MTQPMVRLLLLLRLNICRSQMCNVISGISSPACAISMQNFQNNMCNTHIGLSMFSTMMIGIVPTNRNNMYECKYTKALSEPSSQCIYIYIDYIEIHRTCTVYMIHSPNYRTFLFLKLKYQ